MTDVFVAIKLQRDGCVKSAFKFSLDGHRQWITESRLMKLY